MSSKYGFPDEVEAARREAEAAQRKQEEYRATMERRKQEAKLLVPRLTPIVRDVVEDYIRATRGSLRVKWSTHEKFHTETDLVYLWWVLSEDYSFSCSIFIGATSEGPYIVVTEEDKRLQEVLAKQTGIPVRYEKHLYTPMPRTS